ncbi:hypothetical protein NQZ68_003084 [Dissostichus eleginoides]|nr:hypothetical protein NQZ68_003084 [Dissostichus eleginoides]
MELSEDFLAWWSTGTCIVSTEVHGSEDGKSAGWSAGCFEFELHPPALQGPQPKEEIKLISSAPSGSQSAEGANLFGKRDATACLPFTSYAQSLQWTTSQSGVKKAKPVFAVKILIRHIVNAPSASTGL